MSSLKKIVRIYIFILCTVSVINAYAVETSIQNMRNVSKLYKQHVIIPSHYFFYSKTLKKTVSEGTELNEIWDIELPPNPYKDAALYALPIFIGSTKYVNFSARLFQEDKIASNLRVRQKTFQVEDTKGKKIYSVVNYMRIPVSIKPQRLRVNFTIKSYEYDALEIYGEELELNEKIPVDKAVLIINSQVKPAPKTSIENKGFKLIEHVSENGNVLMEFKLAHPWRPDRKSDVSYIPKVAVSFLTWSEVAQKDGDFYQAELGKVLPSLNDFFQFEHQPQKANSIQDKRKIAYELFRQIGRVLHYKESGLSFNIASKNNPQRIEDVLKSKEGDCKDYALIYMKLLAEVGVYSEPVEVQLSASVGPTPLSSTIPREFQFNHVIVYIPDLNQYIDPTASNSTEESSGYFNIQSESFSNTHGLHLFSKELRLIEPKLSQNNIVVKTEIRKSYDGWFGTTSWIARGNSVRSLMLIDQRRKKLISDGLGYEKPFQIKSLESRPDSWNFKSNDLLGEIIISFSYRIKNAPVDSNGNLIHIPEGIMRGALFRYAQEKDLNNRFCFWSEHSEEVIKILGVNNVDNFEEAKKITLEHSGNLFAQEIKLRGDSATIHRKFNYKELKTECSTKELENKEKFFDEIKVLISK